MVKYVKASDFTHLFVDQSVLSMMVQEIDGETIFDFEDVHIMDRDLSILAEIVLETGVKVIGLDEESQQLLESYVRKLEEPEYEDLEEFKEMFLVKFPQGTLCIWDKSLKEDLLPNESKLSLVMVEGIKGNYVYFRLYKSHLMEPRYVHMYGGLNSEKLYTIESFHISDFANKSIMFRYPKDEREEIIIDILKSM